MAEGMRSCETGSPLNLQWEWMASDEGQLWLTLAIASCQIEGLQKVQTHLALGSPTPAEL